MNLWRAGRRASGRGWGGGEKEMPRLLDLNPLLDLKKILDLNPLLDLKEYSKNFRGVCFRIPPPRPMVRLALSVFLFLVGRVGNYGSVANTINSAGLPYFGGEFWKFKFGIPYLCFYNTFFLLILSLSFFSIIFLKP